MEERALAAGRNFREMDLAEQDALWEEVKEAEGQGSEGAEEQGGKGAGTRGSTGARERERTQR
jgi:hypothetical protein